YALFFATFCYLIGFTTDLVVPKSVSSGTPGALAPALLMNVALVLLFAVQHTIMARPAFKKRWSHVISPAAERSTFVLAATVCVVAMMAFWQPMPGSAWSIQTPALRVALHAIALSGWGFVLFSSFVINHFDLFGLRQVYLHLRNRPNVPLTFRTVG